MGTERESNMTAHAGAGTGAGGPETPTSSHRLGDPKAVDSSKRDAGESIWMDPVLPDLPEGVRIVYRAAKRSTGGQPLPIPARDGAPERPVLDKPPNFTMEESKYLLLLYNHAYKVCRGLLGVGACHGVVLQREPLRTYDMGSL